MSAITSFQKAAFAASLVAAVMNVTVFGQTPPQGYFTINGALWRGGSYAPVTTLYWSKMTLQNSADPSSAARFDGVGAYMRTSENVALSFYTKNSAELNQAWNTWQDAIATFDRKSRALDDAQAEVNAARQERDAINKNKYPNQWNNADQKLQNKIALRDAAQTELNQARQARNDAEAAYNAVLAAYNDTPAKWTDAFTPPASFNPRIRLNTGVTVHEMSGLWLNNNNKTVGPPGNPPSGGQFGNTNGWNHNMYSIVRLTGLKNSTTAYGIIDTWGAYKVSYSAPPPWNSGSVEVPPPDGSNPLPPVGEDNPEPYGSPGYFAEGADGQYNYYMQDGGYIYNLRNMRNGDAGAANRVVSTYAEFSMGFSNISANTNSGSVTGFLRRGQTVINPPNFPFGILEVNRRVQREGVNIALRAQNIVKEWSGDGVLQSHSGLRITRQATAPAILPSKNVVAATTGEIVAEINGNEPTSITATSRPYMENESTPTTTYFTLWGKLGASHGGNVNRWTQMSVISVDRYGITANLSITARDRLGYQAGRYRTRVDAPWTLNMNFVQAFLPPTHTEAEIGDYAVDMRTSNVALAGTKPGSIAGSYLSASSVTTPVSAAASYGSGSYFRRTTATPDENRAVNLNPTFQGTTGGGFALYQPFTQATRSTSWTPGQSDTATRGSAILSPVGIDVFPMAGYSTSVFGSGNVDPFFGQGVDYRGSGIVLDDASNGVGVLEEVYPNSLSMGLLRRPDGSWVELWRHSDTTGRVNQPSGVHPHTVNIGDYVNADGDYQYHVIEYSPVDTNTLSGIGVSGTGSSLATTASNAHISAVSAANGESLNSSYFGWARVARYDFTATNQVRVNAALVTAQ